MKGWGKREEVRLAGRGVARAAVEGCSHEELLREAAAALLENPEADRAGVWLAPTATSRDDAHGLLEFRGVVLDRTGQTAAEWSRLSPGATLSEELLAGHDIIDQEIDSSSSNPIIGALFEMRRAVWLPMEAQGELRGVLFVGFRKKHAVVPRALLESVAAELALAFTLHDQQNSARIWQSDAAVTRTALAAIAVPGASDAILKNLADSCCGVHPHRFTASDTGDVAFAAIGQIRDTTSPAKIVFSWHSGDFAWTHALDREPVSDICHRALADRQLVGVDAGAAGSREDVQTIVAIPLQAAGEILGVLVAGLRAGRESLLTLDRLELHAALAASALRARNSSEKAEQSAAWQRALLRAPSISTILLDQTGKIAELSTAAEELLTRAVAGPTRRPVVPSIGQSFAKIFRMEEQPRIAVWLRDLRETSSAKNDASESLEAELGNGARVILRNATPGNREVVAIDIEAVHRRDADAQKQRAETELFNVLEWLEEGVLLFDAHGAIRMMNTRFAQMTGLNPADIGAIHTLESLIASLQRQAAEPENFAERWRNLARNLDGGIREELHFSRPVPRVLERAARPVLDPSGQLLGRVEIYRDLTAHRVFQSKLLQTEKLAALGQLIGGVAHELSNPLTSILGYAQRLLLRDTAAGRSEEAHRIFQEAERATTIVRQLLTTARETRAERRRVALNQVVAKTIELQRFNMSAEKVRIELDLDPVLPFVQGDAAQLQQVLMNLVGNARQALEQEGRGGTVRIRTRRVAEETVLLEVSDDGPGIPPTILARIFDPFFTTKPAGVGTGLGLAIVLGIVREHGGQVHVSSPPNGGATFSLEFPAAPAEKLHLPALHSVRKSELQTVQIASPAPRRSAMQARNSSAPGESTALRAATKLRNWNGIRVLIVEDEPTVARLIADVLEDAGLKVDVTLDGREALTRAATQTYDLVICDMKMPGFDGQAFYKALVRTQNPLVQRFLFVTGDVLAAHTQQFLDRNGVAHLAKPFLVEELTEKIQHVLTGMEPRKTIAAAKTNVARK
ncbi:MAG TPA: ATP-binding protein [Candidatus Acidoferrum sp.]|jgi:signal transduction histidine kinase/CheY-like chemotaxis protein